MTQQISCLVNEDVQNGVRRFHNRQDDQWHVQIMQGEFYVTNKDQEVLTTILGSCISACIRDPLLAVGGMNHFLLPEGEGADRHAHRFGVNAMEVLINAILQRGGIKSRLQAKIFGGANVIGAMSDVGSRNEIFARQFLSDEGIPVVGGDVGGNLPRRIQYWPASGRARQLSVRVNKESLAQQEQKLAAICVEHAPDRLNDVELF